MTYQEWFVLFDENYPKFKWMVDVHFVQYFEDKIETARKNYDFRKLVGYLTMIWFTLPDNQFNIVENPDGWMEFLEVIEAATEVTVVNPVLN